MGDISLKTVFSASQWVMTPGQGLWVPSPQNIVVVSEDFISVPRNRSGEYSESSDRKAFEARRSANKQAADNVSSATNSAVHASLAAESWQDHALYERIGEAVMEYVEAVRADTETYQHEPMDPMEATRIMCSGRYLG